MDRNNGRNSDGTFARGNRGRPAGSRNRATLAVEALFEGEAEGLSRKAIELGLNGDVAALKLCLDRIAPPPRQRRVNFELPRMDRPADAAKAAASVIRSVSSGVLAPSEGAHVMQLIEVYRRTLELGELEVRLGALEARLA